MYGAAHPDVAGIEFRDPNLLADYLKALSGSCDDNYKPQSYMTDAAFVKRTEVFAAAEAQSADNIIRTPPCAPVVYTDTVAQLNSATR